MVEESAVTYTLGFYVDAKSLDGKLHELKVQVTRPGLNIRYPKGYFAFKDEPPSMTLSALSRHTLSARVRDSFFLFLQGPLTFSS